MVENVFLFSHERISLFSLVIWLFWSSESFCGRDWKSCVYGLN